MSKLDANEKFNNANSNRKPTKSPNLFHWFSEENKKNLAKDNIQQSWLNNIERERKRYYRSWRYELYSRMVGMAISHHKINLYTITGFRGGTQRQNFRKNVFSSTVRKMMQRLRTWINRHGSSKGCHSSLSHCAGVNCPSVRLT